MRAVVDTSVLVDIFLVSRPRHLIAIRLVPLVNSDLLEVWVPFSSAFELSAAIKNEKLSKPIDIDKSIQWTKPFKLLQIPIDENFFNKYFDISLPYIKAGDLLFLALAKGENIPLVTEDERLRMRALEAGVAAHTTEDFLNTFYPGS